MDLSYPHHLHESHDNYPLAPESLEIGRNMYSPAQQEVFLNTTPQRKLTPNLRDKVKYVSQLESIPLIGSCSHQRAPSVVILVVGMVEDIYRFQLSSTFISWKQFLNNSVYGKT